jgi:addiction module RelB/DinJ family antitoxin
MKANQQRRTTMAATSINIYTDSELEARAQSVLADLGLDMSTAFNMFLTRVVNDKSVPTEIAREIPKGKIPRSELCGCMEVWLSDDFDEPLEEMREYME